MSRNLAVLLFEPSEDARQKITTGLGDLSARPTVSVAKDEADLLKQLNEGSFDLAIIDHKTCDAKGDRIVEQLKMRTQFPKINKFLITSIHLNEAGKPTEIGEIPLTFVSKPFRAEVLDSTLISLLEPVAPAQDPKWKLDARLLNPFIEALLENCDESMRLGLTKKAVDLKNKADLCDLSVTSIFDRGDLFGSFSVGFPEKTFLLCSKKITKNDDRGIHQKNLHVAEDFLSSTLKKVSSSLAARKMDLKFRSPIVTMGKQHLAPTIPGLKPIVIKFESDEGLPLHIELSLQKNSALT